jgi:methylated-DNA-[protein]-cysteine S-methyltransferase
MNVDLGILESPVGPIAVAWSGPTVLAAFMQEATRRSGWDPGYAAVAPEARLREHLASRFRDVTWRRDDDGEPIGALRRYFHGDVRAIGALEADPGGTPFQAEIWRRLRDIAPGETTTYGELARAAGRPEAARAVGGAVGANPIPVIIPCHRVVGSTGSLTGFGGGLPRKKWLLGHEGAIARELL